MAELGIVAAQGREGLKQLLTIIADEKDARLPIDARASLIVLAAQLCRIPMALAVRNWSIADIRIGKRHRQELGDIESLAKSIEMLGLLHPIAVTPAGSLIAGARRIAESSARISPSLRR